MKKKTAALLGLAEAAGAAVTAKIYTRKKEDEAAEKTDGTGQTVLITGASGGIGKELAFVFARHHFNIVAVARREQKLEELKMELENSYDVVVYTIVKDLSDENAAKEIFEETEAKGIVVDQLVNNAGAGKQSTVTDADPDTMRDLIHLNVTTLTLLSHYYGRAMAERGRGRIMNVSSIGAFGPDPYFNVYGPSKAYERYLTETMFGELKGTGVTISALCPGPTKTNWAKNAGKADSKMAKSPEEVAEAGFIGMQAGRIIIIPNAEHAALIAAGSLVPPCVKTRIVASWQQSLIHKA